MSNNKCFKFNKVEQMTANTGGVNVSTSTRECFATLNTRCNEIYLIILIDNFSELIFNLLQLILIDDCCQEY